MAEVPQALEPLTAHAEILVSNVDKKTSAGERPVRLCNYMDAYTTPYLDGSHTYMTATASPREMHRFGLRKGDVVITKDSETPDDIGIAAVIDDAEGSLPLVCGYHLAILRTSTVDPVFLAKQLVHDRIKAYFGARATGSTRYGLSTGVLDAVPLFVPPRLEQERIGQILRMIDQAIRLNETVIAKLENVKRGLLHDLLSRGIDDNGEIRNPACHPDEFLDSQLGRIPRTWSIERLVDHVQLPSGQVDPRKQPYRNWILVAPDHVQGLTGRLLERRTAAEQAAISGKYVFEAGDVVYSKIRPYLRKAVLAEFRGLCSADMYPLRPIRGMSSRYLLAVILSEPFSRFAEAVSMRSGFPKINRTELAEYSFPIAPVPEQARISVILESHEDRLVAEQEGLEKLRLLKKGLADDLLTGHVRVHVESQ